MFNSEVSDSRQAEEQLGMILTDMRVGVAEWDLANAPLPDLADYQTLVVAVSDLEMFGESILDLCSWVEQGGSAMFCPAAPEGDDDGFNLRQAGDCPVRL